MVYCYKTTTFIDINILASLILEPITFGSAEIVVNRHDTNYNVEV